VSLLQGLHSGWATLLICTLLFVEEAGVPLPFAPGDLLLLTGGLLIAGGLVPAWVFLPVALVATIGGALVGYSWSRLVGAERLGTAAHHLGVSRSLERVSNRLRAASPVGIAVCRSLPGLRVYTTLVAGATGLGRGTFVLGMVPAAFTWVVAFTLLGVAVGLPAEHLLERVNQAAVRGAILLAVGLVGFLALRYAPGASGATLSAPGRWRLPAAVAIDAGIVGSVAAGLSALARLVFHSQEPNDYFEILTAIAVLAFLFILLTRIRAGKTPGEVVLSIDYRPTRGTGRATNYLRAGGICSSAPYRLRPGKPWLSMAPGALRGNGSGFRKAASRPRSDERRALRTVVP
jgi:membrane protein DedA with SNARE-associated domain